MQVEVKGQLLRKRLGSCKLSLVICWGHTLPPISKTVAAGKVSKIRRDLFCFTTTGHCSSTILLFYQREHPGFFFFLIVFHCKDRMSSLASRWNPLSRLMANRKLNRTNCCQGVKRIPRSSSWLDGEGSKCWGLWLGGNLTPLPPPWTPIQSWLSGLPLELLNPSYFFSASFKLH